MVAVAGDEVVKLTEEGNRSSGYGFLADVEVKESADLALLVDANAALFKMANAGHFGVEGNFIRLGE